MNSYMAVTNNQRFIYRRIEDENLKLKKKEQLKNLLVDSEFSMKGNCAISLLLTKLDIINTILLMKASIKPDG